jgi:uncharacterized FlaG/YvyC family protein
MVEEIGAIGPVGGAGDPASTATLPASAAVRPLKPPAAQANPQKAAAQPASKAAQPSAQQIQANLSKVNAQLASVNRVMQLQVDRATGLTIVTVRNSQTGQVLQQFPSADSVALAQMLSAWASGKNVLVDLIA